MADINPYGDVSDVEEEVPVTSFKTSVSEYREEDNDATNLLDDPGALVEEIRSKEKAKKTAVAGKKKKGEVVPKYSWTTDAIEALISEWEDRPILFNCTHKEYHLKDKNRIALENICQKMIADHEIDPAPTAEEILKK